VLKIPAFGNTQTVVRHLQAPSFMKKLLTSILCLSPAFVLLAQDNSNGDSSWKKIYRETAPRINDLVHTKLDARFDFDKAYMYGKAWITFKPHFYSTDSLTLDAMGIDIHKVAVLKGATMKDLNYRYDNWQLKITLDRLYKGGELCTIYIDYTAKPDEIKEADKDLHEIDGIGGLQFSNPRGEIKTVPTQLWTLGETEQNSIWVPTIDKPNQKSTEEIYMTVPDKFVTLSNGKLIGQMKNNDGTRTDHWKMDLPNAPYLFFMAAGEYAVIKDSWKGKEISYYVEKDYAPVARRIFGITPAMIGFFSKLTGVDYPWSKYSQITSRHPGLAMENTSATLVSDGEQQDARELTDGNRAEPTIAHELFHQWFGDYVTCESWSNITLNESFADLGQVLWNEYKHGKDSGEAKNFSYLSFYLSDTSNANKDLVPFYYAMRDDAFNQLSYQKGSCILTMLRYYVGDSAFFKSINLYLTTNKFKSAEAQNLRLAFEEVTGKDLNWFWNQWYYSNGHPKLDIHYSYDEANMKVKVVVNQTQASDKLFILPVAIDIYHGLNKQRFQVWLRNKEDSFNFPMTKPDLVNFDGDKILVAEKKENKTLAEYIYQYNHAGNYVDRREAIDFAAKNQTDTNAIEFLKLALEDKYAGLRNYTIGKLDFKNESVKLSVEPLLVELAKKDSNRIIKATAIRQLSQYKNPAYTALFKAFVNDSSYTVSGASLFALSVVDSADALNEAKRLSAFPSKGRLSNAIISILVGSDDGSSGDMVLGFIERMNMWQNKFQILQPIGNFLIKTKNTDILKRGVDDIISCRDAIPAAYRNRPVSFINGTLLKNLMAKKKEAGLVEQADYIQSKLPAENNK